MDSYTKSMLRSRAATSPGFGEFGLYLSLLAVLIVVAGVSTAIRYP